MGNRNDLLGILEQIKSMPTQYIEKELKKVKINKCIQDTKQYIFYSKFLCRALDAKYNDLSKNDILRATYGAVLYCNDGINGDK